MGETLFLEGFDMVWDRRPHRLRRLGVHCLDVPARAMSTSVINRYLEIKRRELV